MENIHVKLYETGPVVKQDMSFKDFLSGALETFCSVEQNHLCNFCRGYYEEHFCEVGLNLDQWFRCHLKDFLPGAVAALLFIGAEPYVQFSASLHCGP